MVVWLWPTIAGNGNDGPFTSEVEEEEEGREETQIIRGVR